MINPRHDYSEFYKNAWRENVYGSTGNNLALNNADDSYWISYACALQAFEKAYELAKQGYLLDESKEIYLGLLEGKTKRDEIPPNHM